MHIVGYIPMVADLFHVGHINVLQKAKENCLFLIVGVLTDEAVRSYKVEDTVIPQGERMTMLRACKYADHVVEQTELDPSKNLELYQPDVFFSGGPLEDVEKIALGRASCDVVEFPRYEGQSSTLIKERIRQRV